MTGDVSPIHEGTPRGGGYHLLMALPLTMAPVELFLTQEWTETEVQTAATLYPLSITLCDDYIAIKYPYKKT